MIYNILLCLGVRLIIILDASLFIFSVEYNYNLLYIVAYHSVEVIHYCALHYQCFG